MRKHNHNKIISISKKQIEAVERQYWSRYNNNMLDSMLNHRLNTNTSR